MAEQATVPSLTNAPASPIAVGKSRRRWKRVLWLLGFVILLCLASLAIFATMFPGFTLLLYRDLRYSTWHENRNLSSSFAYFTHFMQKMSFDRKQKVWNFDSTPEAKLDAFEKGRLAFHRGDFSKAVSLLRQEIQT